MTNCVNQTYIYISGARADFTKILRPKQYNLYIQPLSIDSILINQQKNMLVNPADKIDTSENKICCNAI